MEVSNKKNVKPVVVVDETVGVGNVFSPSETAALSMLNILKSQTDEELEAEKAKAIAALEQLKVEKQMVAYLNSTGRFEVTPSGTPVGIIHGTVNKVTNGLTAVGDTAVSGFHVGRGVFRKIGNTISSKVTELKNLGA